MTDNNIYEYARLELPLPPMWEYRKQDALAEKDDINEEEETSHVIIIEL